MNILQICPPNLSNVNTLPREIQKSFSTVLFIHSSVYMLRKNTALRDESVELVLGEEQSLRWKGFVSDLWHTNLV